MSGRPTYTPAQLCQVFDRIRLPHHRRLFSVTDPLLSDSDRLAYLALLLRHQLIHVPFENLTQHYSWHRVVNVEPQHLFEKIVLNHDGGDRAQARRGGYCMEVNTFFHTLLYSLGYKAYIAGARVFEGGQYGGLSHCVNMVVIGGTKYVVDVGFGANGPVEPLPLVPNAESDHVPPARIRLLYEPLPQQINQECCVWVCQIQVNDGFTSFTSQERQKGQKVQDTGGLEGREGVKEMDNPPWTNIYCIVDHELLPADIRGMNLSPATSPRSFFPRKVVMSRFTTKPEEDGLGDAPELSSPSWDDEKNIPRYQDDMSNDNSIENAFDNRETGPHDTPLLTGALILWQDTLKWRCSGKTVWAVTLHNEVERLRAVRRYFGIAFGEADRMAIKGTASEIVG